MNNNNGYINADTGLAALKEYTWAGGRGASCLQRMTGGRGSGSRGGVASHGAGMLATFHSFFKLRDPGTIHPQVFPTKEICLLKDT